MTVRLTSITCSGDILPLVCGAFARTPSPKFQSRNISCLDQCTSSFRDRFLIVVIFVFVRVIWHYSVIIVRSEVTDSSTVDALQSPIRSCDTGNVSAKWTDSAMLDMILSWPSGLVVELTHFELVETAYERTAKLNAPLFPCAEVKLRLRQAET